MKKRFNTLSRKAFIGSLLGLTVAVVASSCKKDDGYQFDGSVSAKVQLVNASPDAGPSQLFIDDVLRTPNAVAYSNVSGYYDSYVGQQDVAVKSASGTTLATTSTQIDATAKYSFFLAGSGATSAVVAVKDDQTAPASGMARVRFVQAAADAPAANVTLNNNALFTSLNYKGISAYADVTPGAVTFRLVNAANSTVLITSAAVNLVAGKIYTIYSKGSITGTGDAALSIGAVTTN